MAIDWKGKAQPALTAAGTYHGKVDGVRGPKTLRALLDYAAGWALGSDGDARAAVAVNQYDKHELTTPARLAEFLAQVTHETGDFRRLVENLNYDAGGLARTWPSRFAIDPGARIKLPNSKAHLLAGKPQDIANAVYARPIEGNTAPGDGWRYRGRGDLQLTFRNNYAAMAKLVDHDLVADPDIVALPSMAHRVALEAWTRLNVNPCCDAGDFYGSRGLTNAGSRHPKAPPIGLADVAARRVRLLKVLS